MRSLRAKFLWLAAVGSAASGCATQIPPPSAPTATQIAATAAEIATANVTPSDYAALGLTLAQRSCANWFSNLVQQADSTRFGTSALATVGGVAAAAGGPAGMGAAAGASVLAALLGAHQASSPAGLNPAAAYGLVSRIQQAWRAAMPTPITTADAYAMVEAYSEQCGLPAVQNDVAQALMTVPVSATPPAPLAAPVSVAQAYQNAGHARSPRLRSRPELSQDTKASSLQREWEESGRPFTARLPQVVIGR